MFRLIARGRGKGRSTGPARAPTEGEEKRLYAEGLYRPLSGGIMAAWPIGTHAGWQRYTLALSIVAAHFGRSGTGYGGGDHPAHVVAQG